MNIKTKDIVYGNMIDLGLGLSSRFMSTFGQQKIKHSVSWLALLIIFMKFPFLFHRPYILQRHHDEYTLLHFRVPTAPKYLHFLQAESHVGL